MSRAAKILELFKAVENSNPFNEATIDRDLAKLLNGMKPELKQDIIAQVSRKEANFIRDHAKDADTSYDKKIQEYINSGLVTLVLVKQAKKNGKVL